MDNDKALKRAMTVGEVKMVVKAFLDAKVLDSSIVFSMVSCSGLYPVVLLHKNIKKFFKKIDDAWSKNVSEDKEQLDQLCKNLLSYNIDWLMKQNDSILLDDGSGNVLGTPVARILNDIAYSTSDASREDPDSMRIDIVAPFEAGDKLALTHWPAIDGWVISSMTKRQVYAMLGSTAKMLKLNDACEKEEDNDN